MKPSRLIALVSLLSVCSGLVFSQIPVGLPNVVGQVGTTMNLAVTTGDLTGKSIVAYTFVVRFDTSVVNISSASIDGTITPNPPTVRNPVSDSTTVKVTFAAATPLAGSGTLVFLEVQLKKVGTTSLTFTEFTYELTSGQVVPVSTTNGNMQVRLTANQRPTIAAIGAKTVMETDTLTFVVTATDPDAGEVLTYTASSLPSGASFNATTRTFSWVPALGQQGNYTARFKVTDFGGLSDSTTVSITVTKKNSKPTISAISPKTVTETDTLNFTVTANDPDVGDVLTFSESNLPSGASFNAATHAFLWVPALGQAGSYAPRFKVTDAGGLIDSTVVAITVTKKEIRPTLNAIATKTVAEKDTLAFTVTVASSHPNDTLTFGVSNPPSGASFNTATHAFLWVPNYQQNGTYSPRFKVSNQSGLSDSITVTITVNKTNAKPALASRVPATVSVVSFNTPFAFRVSVIDPNGDPITYTWKVNGAVEKTGPDSTYTKTFSATNAPQSVVCLFADPGGLKDSTSWSFTITEVETGEMVPTEFALGQNYPNPFNPSTTIRFSLPREVPVTLEIYNVLGVKVRTLSDGRVMSAAFHTVVWDGRDEAGAVASTGVYLYRIQAGQFVAARKMTVLK